MAKKIPAATMDRYPHYLRVLRIMRSKGVRRSMSADIAEAMEIEPTTVRRDFSYLGHLGRQGYGYNLDELIEGFDKELGDGAGEKVVLIGMGNMGKALIKYNTFEYRVGKIVCAFEADESKVDVNAPVPVYHINDIKTYFPQGVKIAILAMPGEFAQQVADTLVNLGVNALINFSDGDIVTKRGVIVQQIDLISMIQDVIYKFKRKQQVKVDKKQTSGYNK
jgi:redox-sensing transcriptional repressor